MCDPQASGDDSPQASDAISRARLLLLGMKMHTDNEDYRRRLAAEAERLRGAGALGRSDLLIRLFDFLLQASLSGRSPKEIEIAHEVFEKSGEIGVGQDAPVRT